MFNFFLFSTKQTNTFIHSLSGVSLSKKECTSLQASSSSISERHPPAEVRKDTGLSTSNQVQKPQKSSVSPSRTHRPSDLRRRLDKKPRGSYTHRKSERWSRYTQKTDQACGSREAARVGGEGGSQCTRHRRLQASAIHHPCCSDGNVSYVCCPTWRPYLDTEQCT